MKTTLINKIEQQLEIFTASERKVAEYVIKYPEEVVLMNANELAEKGQSSTSSVMRFCKKIEIPSFTDFKVKLASEMAPTVKLSPAHLTKNNEKEILMNLANNNYQVMLKTAESLNFDDLKRAEEQLSSSNIILAYGVGSSSSDTFTFTRQWQRLGKYVENCDDKYTMLRKLSAAPDETTLITFSNSGLTEEIIEVVKFAKEHNIKVIAITRNNGNILTTLADIVITSSRDFPSISGSNTYSSVAVKLIIDALYYLHIGQIHSKI